MMRKLNIPDIHIAIISLVVTIVGCCLPVFTDASIWITIGSYILNWYSLSGFLCVMSQCYNIINRSVISLAVESGEIGGIYGVLSIFKAILGSTIGAGFQQLYNKTLDSLPGAFLLLASGVLVAAIPSNFLMYKISKSFKSESNINNISHTKITKL